MKYFLTLQPENSTFTNMEKKAKVISVLNFKGGVGKTTTVLNLSAALARHDKKVLIVDLDVQTCASLVLGYSVSDGENIYDLMMDNTKSYPVYNTVEANVQFIPGSMKMDSLIVDLTSRMCREFELRKRIEPLFPYYDYILIDCPPSKSVLTDNALCTSDSLIIPVSCEHMSKQGLATIIVKYEQVKQMANRDLQIEGFLLTKYIDNRNASRNMVSTLEELNVPVFSTRIRQCSSLDKLSEGSNYHNIFNYDEQTFKPGFGRKTIEYSNGAKDYEALALEILNK